MEPLEKTASKNTAVKDEKIESYEGLTLLDDKIYSGGTSIKYWM